MKLSKPFRHRLIQILSPSIWNRLLNIYSISSVPRGSTLYAITHFKDRVISYSEIGVNLGDNVLNVIKTLNIESVYLIDMYKEYETIQDGEPVFYSQKFQDNALKVAKDRLKPFEDKINWILKYSDEAINDLPDNIDFIYIDGNHEYEHVKKDIAIYWEKVSDNGILAGHDFFGSFNGVINAVFEFAMENQLYVYSNLYDWWFIKEV